MHQQGHDRKYAACWSHVLHGGVCSIVEYAVRWIMHGGQDKKYTVWYSLVLQGGVCSILEYAVW